MTNHQINAKTWCQYNGQRGTEKQVRAVALSIAPETLVRMLTERNQPVAG
jgi:hypothetical protein